MTGIIKYMRIASRVCAVASMVVMIAMMPVAANAFKLPFNLPPWLGGKAEAPPVQVIPRPSVAPSHPMAGKFGKPEKSAISAMPAKPPEAAKPEKPEKVADQAKKAKVHTAKVVSLRQRRRRLALRKLRMERLKEEAAAKSFEQYKINLLKSLQLPEAKLVDGRTERWAVKVGLDADAKFVFRSFDVPIEDNVEDLATVPRQPGVENTDQRYEPYESTPWVVEGSIVAFGVAPDGDYVLVLKGTRPGDLSPDDLAAYQKLPGSHFSDTIIAAIPDPKNIASDSAWRANIEVVRFQFDREFTGERHPGPILRRLLYPVNVRITGVGFFDFDHQQEGRAPNILTIHPVLKMEWLDSPSTTAAAPAPSH